MMAPIRRVVSQPEGNRLAVRNCVLHMATERMDVAGPSADDGPRIDSLPKSLHSACFLKSAWNIGIRLRIFRSTRIDIGASVGVFSPWAAARNRGVRLIAVGPSPGSCRFLALNMVTNQLRNETAVRCACGGELGAQMSCSRNWETLTNSSQKIPWADTSTSW
jgi:hypothetical protein